MKRLTHIVRSATLVALCVAALFRPSHATASDERETFGESPTLPSIGTGGGGSADLIDVDELTGAATATIPFELIRARGDVQPSLALHYVSNIDGEAGRNWTLGLPAVERKPLSGLPQYNYDPTSTWPTPAKTDRISFDGADLVPLCTINQGSCSGVAGETFSQLDGWHYYRRLVDRTLERFFWSPDLMTWRVQAPSGVVSEFGVPRNETSYLNATDSEYGQCGAGECPLGYRPPYRWNLVRQWDARGETRNPVAYRWTKYFFTTDDGQEEYTRGYLSDIFDTPRPGDDVPNNFVTWAHHARLDYEPQPFAVRSGANSMLRWRDHRLVLVSVTSKDFVASNPRSEVRMYALLYTDAPAGASSRANSSYLTQVIPKAMAPLGSCVENPDFTLPLNCPARPLVTSALSLTYDGINATENAHACETSEFAGPAQTMFMQATPPSMLQNVLLHPSTVIDGNGDGLADIYLPKPSTTQDSVAFTNQVPSNGLLSAATTSVDGRFHGLHDPPSWRVDAVNFLSPTMLNIIGDWGYDGASVLYAFGGGDTKLSDPIADVTYAQGYMLFRGLSSTTPFSWKEVVEVTNPQCNYYNACPGTSTCSTNGACSCNADSDCPASTVCQSGACVLPTGALFSDINHDGLVDEFTALGVRVSTRDSTTGHVLPFAAPLVGSWAQNPQEDMRYEVAVDVNGDGFADLALLPSCLGQNGQYTCTVNYLAGDGRGHFAPPQNSNGYFTPDQVTVQLADTTTGVLAGLHDINGDGLADLVVFGSTEIAVFLNRDGLHWVPTGVMNKVGNALGNRQFDKGVFGDFDGDGIDDAAIISAGDLLNDSTFDPDAMSSARVHQCGRLVTASNGYGAQAHVYYDTVAHLEQVGRSHGKSPIAFNVVVGVDTTIPGGAPSSWSRSYFYDDPQYDFWRRSFRGFKESRVRTAWNESFASNVVNGTAQALHHTSRRTQYLIGGCDLSLATEDNPVSCNPDLDDHRQLPALPVIIDEFGDANRQVDLSNPYPYVAPPNTTYKDTTILSYLPATSYANGLDGRVVKLLARTKVDTYLYDTALAAADDPTTDKQVLCIQDLQGGSSCQTIPVTLHSPPSHRTHLRRSAYYDSFGNMWADEDSGVVDDAGNSLDPTDPPITLNYTSVRVNGEWIWRRTDVSIYGRGAIGQSFDLTRHLTFAWDTTGNLTNVYGDLVGTVALSRFHESQKQTALDPADESVDKSALILATFTVDPLTGNVTRATGPNGRCVDFAFDGPYRQLATATTTYTDGCDSTNPLVVNHSFGAGGREFATPTMVSAASGARAEATLDDRGRIVTVEQPHANTISATAPGFTVDYDNDGSHGPFHWIHVTGGAREAYTYFDAAGGIAFALNKADPSAGDGGDWVVSGLHAYDNDQQALSYQATYFTGIESNISTPLQLPAEYSQTKLDEYFRPIARIAMDGVTVQTAQYHQLAVDLYSEGGNHSKIERNGHGRVAMSHQYVSGDDLQLRYQYTAAGEVAQLQQTHGNANENVSRWMQYDSLGRLVANYEPNTTDYANQRYWRYAYNDAGLLVGTSDAIGCGANFVYDSAGRLLAEDDSPCLDSQEAYTTPDNENADGVEARYFYNTVGQMVGALDRGAFSTFAYDARGRTTSVMRSVARPGPTPYGLTDRYVSTPNTIETTYDEANRVSSASTGADVPQLLINQQSKFTLHYTQRGLLGAVTSDYDGTVGALLSDLTYEVDGLPKQHSFSDYAKTVSEFQYDPRRRLKTMITRRDGGWATNVPNIYTAPSSNPPTTLQTRLVDLTLDYDGDGNLRGLLDNRLTTEWPTGSMPASRAMYYDEARRMTSIDYGTTDSQVPVFNSGEMSALPSLDIPNRVGGQSFNYDWKGNITQSDDDTSSFFFDRSLGTIKHDDPSAQHRLTSAQHPNGRLSAQYNARGDLVNLVVERSGQCLGPVAKCVQRFVYDWDEVGQLARARRWDYTTLPSNDPPYPQLPVDGPAADLSFKYHQNQRVLKSASNPGGASQYTVNIFPSLRLDATTWNSNTLDYERNTQTESLYIAGIAHVVYDASLPSRDGTALHVLYETGDQVGSTSAVFDRNTGELVERVTNQAYGATDSDYRPSRWNQFREPQRLSGHIDDIEVGLVYFGARYYSPNLQRWLSADPLTVHGVGASFNPYSYVDGSPGQSIDWFGLCDGENCNNGGVGGDGGLGGIIGAIGDAIGSGLCHAFGGCNGGGGGSVGGNGGGAYSGPPPPPPPPPPMAARAFGSLAMSAGLSPAQSAIIGRTAGWYQQFVSINLLDSLRIGVLISPAGPFVLGAETIAELAHSASPNNETLKSLHDGVDFINNAGAPGPDVPPVLQMVHPANMLLGPLAAGMAAAPEVAASDGAPIKNADAGFEDANGSVGAAESAYLTAKNGGRHSGFLRTAEGQTTSQLQRSERNFQKTIELHENKIDNPATFAPTWPTMSPAQQAGLLRYWGKEVTNYSQQQSIVQEILFRRGVTLFTW